MAIAGQAFPAMKLEKIGDDKFRIKTSCMVQKSTLPGSVEEAVEALRGPAPKGEYVIMAMHVYRLTLKGFEIGSDFA